MTPAAIIEAAALEGVRLALSPTGTIKARGNGDAVNRWSPVIREHKLEIISALQREVFAFAPPSDSEAPGGRLQDAREQAWLAFRQNAQRVLEAPAGRRETLLRRYATEAASRYGNTLGDQMARELRGFVGARPLLAQIIKSEPSFWPEADIDEAEKAIRSDPKSLTECLAAILERQGRPVQ